MCHLTTWARLGKSACSARASSASMSLMARGAPCSACCRSMFFSVRSAYLRLHARRDAARVEEVLETQQVCYDPATMRFDYSLMSCCDVHTMSISKKHCGMTLSCDFVSSDHTCSLSVCYKQCWLHGVHETCLSLDRSLSLAGVASGIQGGQAPAKCTGQSQN